MSARDLFANATPQPWTLEADIEGGSFDIWMLGEDETRGRYGPERHLEWNHGLFPGEGDEETWGDGEQYEEATANAALIVGAVNEYEAHVDLENAVRAHPMAEEAFRDVLARLDAIRGVA